MGQTGLTEQGFICIFNVFGVPWGGQGKDSFRYSVQVVCTRADRAHIAFDVEDTRSAPGRTGRTGHTSVWIF